MSAVQSDSCGELSCLTMLTMEENTGQSITVRQSEKYLKLKDCFSHIKA